MTDDKPKQSQRQRVLLALVRNDGNIAATAREINVSAAKIRRWRDETNNLTLDDLEQSLLVHAAVLAGDLLEGTVVTAPLNQRASALGMLVDRLLKLEARREVNTPDTPTHNKNTATGSVRMVFRDRQGNLREWGDWDNDEDEGHADDA